MLVAEIHGQLFIGLLTDEVARLQDDNIVTINLPPEAGAYSNIVLSFADDTEQLKLRVALLSLREEECTLPKNTIN